MPVYIKEQISENLQKKFKFYELLEIRDEH